MRGECWRSDSGVKSKWQSKSLSPLSLFVRLWTHSIIWGFQIYLILTEPCLLSYSLLATPPRHMVGSILPFTQKWIPSLKYVLIWTLFFFFSTHNTPKSHYITLFPMSSLHILLTAPTMTHACCNLCFHVKTQNLMSMVITYTLHHINHNLNSRYNYELRLKLST